MTRGKQRETGTPNLRRHVIDDVLEASDTDILSQYAEDIGSPEENAARNRKLFETTVLLANKDRLLAARAGAAAEKNADRPLKVIPIEDARRKLRDALANHSQDPSFTLAARKETELSDADVLDMLQAMHDLGLLR